MNDQEKTYPEGHFVGKWMGICMAIFSGIGIPLAFIADMTAFIGIGPAIGVAVGVAVGAAEEAKYKKRGQIRPLNEQERKNKKIGLYAAIGLLILALIVFVAFFFLR